MELHLAVPVLALLPTNHQASLGKGPIPGPHSHLT
jgi:hypothetical protein